MSDEHGGKRRHKRGEKPEGLDGPAGYVAERTGAHALPRDPWHFAPWDAADQSALKALRDGNASPNQQHRALGWILFACGMTDDPWRPGGSDGARASDYASGKRRIAVEIRRLIELPSLGASDGGEQGDK
ncbi:MAG TPA: hypothetical protein VKA31_00305 [Mariprofundaceae bacterium]|nr:hypothetical protein [Mariprofundaceae bacterium]